MLDSEQDKFSLENAGSLLEIQSKTLGIVMNNTHVQTIGLPTVGVDAQAAAKAFLKQLPDEEKNAKISDLMFWQGQNARQVRWPRNVPWTSLPVCDGPFYRVGNCVLIHLVTDFNIFMEEADQQLAGQEITERFKQAKYIILWSCDGEKQEQRLKEQALLAAQLLALSGRKDRPICLEIKRSQGLEYSCEKSTLLVQAMDDLEAQRPWERFLWSYRVNFRILLERALLGARQMPLGVGDYILPRQRPHKSFTADEWLCLSHPWALQILLKIQKDIQSGCTDNIWPGLTFEQMPDNWQGVPDQRSFFEWTGSGAHQPIQNIGNPDLEFMVKGYGEAATFLSRTRMVFDQTALRSLYGDIESTARREKREILKQAGEWKEDEPVSERNLSKLEEASEFELNKFFDLIKRTGRLSNQAWHFLSLLPPELNDPDLMLRWRHGPHKMPLDRDIPAMDRWITRAFRAAKKNMNQLQPDGSEYKKASY